MKKLRIGVVVHGPGIIDSGYAIRIIDYLKKYAEVTSRLGGTMGRTAVIDAELENVIKIDRKLLPSQSISLLSEDNDIIFLLNYGKSIITGHTFGYKVTNNIKSKVKIIQVERPGESDGCIIKWGDFDDYGLIGKVSEEFNLKITTKKEASDLVNNLTGYNDQENIVKRKIAGVSPGENIMVNGIIIGKATSQNLTIVSKNNKIIELIGGNIKEHGIEKLGNVNLTKAIVKTGLLRKATNIKPRVIRHEENDNMVAYYLNHAAEDIYDYKDADIVVTIGDDTTLLSSDILYRFNVPIIGITDGDLDKVVLEGFKLDESLIIQVQSGWDDKIGSKIHEKIFKNKASTRINDIESFKKEIIILIEELGVKYHFVDKQLS